MRKDHEKITKWLRDSGLVLNEAKTDLCLFNRSYLRQIQLDFNGSVIKSLPQINMLWLDASVATASFKCNYESKEIFPCTQSDQTVLYIWWDDATGPFLFLHNTKL